MQEYTDSGLARRGHKEVVELMEKGRWKFEYFKIGQDNKQLTS
jgi:hypothetical protein